MFALTREAKYCKAFLVPSEKALAAGHVHDLGKAI